MSRVSDRMAFVSSTLLSRRSAAARIALVLAMMVAFVLLTGLLDGNDLLLELVGQVLKVG